MATENGQVRSIVWAEVFPFLRLFRTASLTLSIDRAILCLLAVMIAYCAGRVLDGLWGESGGVMSDVRRVSAGSARGGGSEIDTYVSAATFDAFDGWRRRVRQERREWMVNAVVQGKLATTADEAEKLLAKSSVFSVLDDETHRKTRKDFADWPQKRRNAGLAAIRNDAELSAAARELRIEQLEEAYRILRAALSRQRPLPADSATRAAAVERMVQADVNVDLPTRSSEQSRLGAYMSREELIEKLEQSRPRGPFISMVEFEAECLAGAIRGALSGRFLFSPGDAGGPTMLGSVARGLRGGLWCVTQRPGFSVLFALVCWLTFAPLGGAVCRSAAVKLTRDESALFSDVLAFVRERLSGFLLAPFLLVAGVVVVMAALWLGGFLIGIPVVGEILGGVLFVAALLGGLALALMAISLVTAFPLMWPVIAVEGSDGFDALTRSINYLFERPWRTLFYYAALLAYGAGVFVFFRLVAVLTLKLTHGCLGAGMGAMDALWPGAPPVFGELDDIWRMPSWNELSLLPGLGTAPFWGTFGNAPLTATETVEMVLVAVWVFLVVGLLAAFVVNFALCGGVQAYLLLRRDRDGTDFDEIYYEDADDGLGAPAEASSETAGEIRGTALPVMNSGGSGRAS